MQDNKASEIAKTDAAAVGTALPAEEVHLAEAGLELGRLLHGQLRRRLPTNSRPSWSHVLRAEKDGAGRGVSTCVLQTKTYLKGVEVVAKLRRLARKRHSAAVAHFASTILAATKVDAPVDEDSLEIEGV